METETEEKGKTLVRLTGREVKGKIRFDDVSFSYRDGEQTLKNVNLDIKPGEKIAIVGANGSGKSTLINLLLRFYKPCSGKIEIDGTDINSINLKDYRGLISVVSQDLYLFDTSIEENISIGLKKEEGKINKVAKESGAYEFIMDMPLKYKSKVGRNGSNLSGGQRQKVAVARAFARESKILVLDEATANYDVESEAYLNQFMTSDFNDKTVLVISHKPDILSKVDKIWFMNNGSIQQLENYRDFKKGYKENEDLLVVKDIV
ncbi:ATP-binding cassette subfamily B protein [Ruminiclostridium sufflavum DSM 19573]|uniref:ATP-binding cassette subfamily B protein n=1 Tax=Ruminiclostridium sufflavum DSM 19573 TaxID=1121337 RepID=A0A318XQX5_9FIRM|nr:ABC transporter ATP-binding protein [Ruminiclostridium sufflavum]PYG89723.1 ATP-binding cassette subfamily B protein [Ruminiclostridium sufflavum DSM 19573]